MFFTQDDYKKIQLWLLRNSIKDSDLNNALYPFNGRELITLVQGDFNVKVNLSDFIELLLLLGCPDVLNLSALYDKRDLTLQEAINLVPANARKIGLIILFLSDKWNLYQFCGHSLVQWNTLDTWVNLNKEIEGIKVDDETITLKKGVLLFKNKKYNPDKYSGKGYVYIKKNLMNFPNPISGVEKECNVLLDYNFRQPNSIYVILYDFDLAGNYVLIPKNCVLKIQGGSITNGTLICDNTCIDSLEPLACTLEGTYYYSNNNCSFGPTEGRPTITDNVVFLYFDTTLGRPIWWFNNQWVDCNGNNI